MASGLRKRAGTLRAVDFKDRLKHAMESQVPPMKKAELAKAIGASYQAVRQALLPDDDPNATKSLSAKHCSAAARVLKVSYAWLSEGKGSMHVTEYSHNALELARWFDALTDQHKRDRAFAINYQMLVVDRWPPLEQTWPDPEPTPAHVKIL